MNLLPQRPLLSNTEIENDHTTCSLDWQVKTALDFSIFVVYNPEAM